MWLKVSRCVVAIVESTSGDSRRCPSSWGIPSRHPQWRPQRHEQPPDPAWPWRRLPGALRCGRRGAGAVGERRGSNRHESGCDGRFALQPASPAQPDGGDAAADKSVVRAGRADAPGVRARPGLGGRQGPLCRRFAPRHRPGCTHPSVPLGQPGREDAWLGRPAAQVGGAVLRSSAGRRITQSRRLGPAPLRPLSDLCGARSWPPI